VVLRTYFENQEGAVCSKGKGGHLHSTRSEVLTVALLAV